MNANTITAMSLRMQLNKFAFALSILVASSVCPGAQDLIPKAAPQDEAFLIEGARVYASRDKLHVEGAVLVEFGQISRVFSNPTELDGFALPAGTRRIDAQGARLYPGFVLAASSLGLTEIGAVDMTRDTNEAGSITPEVSALTAINPDSWHIPVTRRSGVLTAGVWPTGGLLPGRGCAIELDGWTALDMALIPELGLLLNWPYMPADTSGDGAERSRESMEQIDALFDAAEAYGAAKAAGELHGTDLRLQAVADLLNGQGCLFVGAQTQLQIEAAVAWSRKRSIAIRILGGREALLCAELLKRHDIPVAIVGTHRLPRRRDVSWTETYALPAKLEAAGLRWCLSLGAGSASDARNLPFEAAASRGHGLSDAAALHSITQASADFLGLGDQLGSIAAGKRATFFLADGDPFELSTQISAAWISGRKLDLRDKQTQLDAKYREKYRQLGLLPR